MFGTSSGGTEMFRGSSQAQPAFGASSTQPSSFSFGSTNNTSNNAWDSSTNTNTIAQGSGSTLGTSSSQPFTLSGSALNPLTLAQNPASDGGIFGSSTANTTSNNTFGGNTTSSNAFGGNNSGIFSTLNKNNSALGATSASGGNIFGKPAGATSTSIFGNNTSQPSTQSGLFGSKPVGQTGGLFGGVAQKTQSTDNGLLGTSNTQNTQSNTSSGLFGQSGTTGGTSGGLFGNTNQSSNQNSSFSLNKNQTQNNTGLFRSNNLQPFFGWSNYQAPDSGQKSTLSSNLQLNLAIPSQTPKNLSNYTPAINDQIIKLKEQWDPSSSKCAFKTYLYNRFSEQEVAVLLQQPRPANESPEDWENAMAYRPSALHYPVKVSSFTEVAQRIEVQLDHVAKSRVLLNNIYEQLNQLSSKHDLDNTTRILKAKVRHAKLSRRLLRLATVLAVLKLKGYPMLPEEEEMSKQFQVLNSRLSDPNGPLGKLSDLYARLAILKSRSEDMSAHMESSIQSINSGLAPFVTEKDGSTEIVAANEHTINQLTKLLYKQQVGLSYLNDVVEKDLEKVKNEKKST